MPGEFHEDRWQRTAEDSETPVFPRTREAGGTHRIQVIAWISVLLTGLRHGHPAQRCSRGIPSWRRGHLSALRHGHPAHRCLRGILAWQRGLLTDLRHVDPCPQVRQYQPRVSESGASIGALRNASRRGTGCSTRGGEIRR